MILQAAIESTGRNAPTNDRPRCCAPERAPVARLAPSTNACRPPAALRQYARARRPLARPTVTTDKCREGRSPGA
jgi:hypothetical protein